MNSAQVAKLLILDDDAAVGQVLQIVATHAGHEAEFYTTIDDFLAAVSREQPTHISIDLNLAGSNSGDVLRRLASAGCPAQVIVCSGTGRDAMQEALATVRSLGLPVGGALAKPFTFEDVEALLRPHAAACGQ